MNTRSALPLARYTVLDLTITNTGSGVLPWRITANRPWVTVSEEAGVALGGDVPCAPGCGRNATVRLSVNPRQILGSDAAAVVRYANSFAATFFNRHVDPRRTRVHRVLQQLFHYARRPLNHFPGGNLRHHFRRQLSNSGHEVNCTD